MSIPENRSRPRWIHLDLKGAVPTLSRLLEWIDRFGGQGIDGLLLEAEDRYPWRCWEGLFRPGYTHQEWQRLLDHVAGVGLTVTPLVQVQGHLEWILRDPRYAPWRENGKINEICPQHAVARQRLAEWVDEAIEAFPGSPYLHLGADETWSLATCPACRALAEAHPDGKMGIYVDHVQAFCRQVVSRGRRPMIWADMFVGEQCSALASRLPRETILVDWQYRGASPWTSVARLAESGLEVWGASAARNFFDTTQVMGTLSTRIENVRRWEEQFAGGGVAGLIHTTWARSRSTAPVYGPWEGWLPALNAIGRTHVRGRSASIERGLQLVDQIGLAATSDAIAPLLVELQAVSSDDRTERSALRWWCLAARHRSLYLDAGTISAVRASLSAVEPFVGHDSILGDHYRALADSTLGSLDTWERDARDWWEEHGWSDADEFFASRTAAVRHFVFSLPLKRTEITPATVGSALPKVK